MRAVTLNSHARQRLFAWLAVLCVHSRFSLLLGVVVFVTPISKFNVENEYKVCSYKFFRKNLRQHVI